jgi:hypothetical protein
LAHPDLTPQERTRLPKEKQPAVLKGFVLQTKKGSKSPVTAKDICGDVKLKMGRTILSFRIALAMEKEE